MKYSQVNKLCRSEYADDRFISLGSRLQAGESRVDQRRLLLLVDPQASRRRARALFARDAAQLDLQPAREAQIHRSPRAHVLRLFLHPVELVDVTERL